MKWIKAIQVNSDGNEELIKFIDKYSNGKSSLILSWQTNGYGLQTRFGKLFITWTDWITWDGYDFTPYSDAHYQFLIDEELKENPPFSGGQKTRLDESPSSEVKEQQGEPLPEINSKQDIINHFDVLNICNDDRLTTSEKVDEIISKYILIKR